MATGEERFFESEGLRYRIWVSGPLEAGPPKRRWWQIRTPRARPSTFEWVQIAMVDDRAAKPLRMLIERDTLRIMTDEDLRRTLAEARDLAKIPPAQAALALVRPGAEFVVSRGEWNVVRAIAFSCGWTAGHPDTVSDDEALQLAALFRQLEQDMAERRIEPGPLRPPAGLIDFLDGGGFTVSEIG